MSAGVEVGDTVEWTSQSAGVRKTKRGTVAARVLPMEEPNDALERSGSRGRLRDPGYPRDHLSFVVRAGGRLYWPRVTQITHVEAP